MGAPGTVPLVRRVLQQDAEERLIQHAKYTPGAVNSPTCHKTIVLVIGYFGRPGLGTTGRVMTSADASGRRHSPNARAHGPSFARYYFLMHLNNCYIVIPPGINSKWGLQSSEQAATK